MSSSSAMRRAQRLRLTRSDKRATSTSVASAAAAVAVKSSSSRSIASTSSSPTRPSMSRRHSSSNAKAALASFASSPVIDTLAYSFAHFRALTLSARQRRRRRTDASFVGSMSPSMHSLTLPSRVLPSSAATGASARTMPASAIASSRRSIELLPAADAARTAPSTTVGRSSVPADDASGTPAPAPEGPPAPPLARFDAGAADAGALRFCGSRASLSPSPSSMIYRSPTVPTLTHASSAQASRLRLSPSVAPRPVSCNFMSSCVRSAGQNVSAKAPSAAGADSTGFVSFCTLTPAYARRTMPMMDSYSVVLAPTVSTSCPSALLVRRSLPRSQPASPPQREA
mmetsp:Transcript_14846/g.39333  ORF Transcript_14846/g.39333 Transcript_14846/m.39333 type:complete len:342 (+) Transcript_14846:723-1748(+)